MKHSIVMVAVVFLIACRSDPAGGPAPAVVTWRAVESWSGRGSAQLATFVIDAGVWRARWETRNETPAGSGYFTVTAHSADSGRVIAEIANQKGVGRGTENVTETPRRYYLTVDSANVEWSITVEEPAVQATGPRQQVPGNRPPGLRPRVSGIVYWASGAGGRGSGCESSSPCPRPHGSNRVADEPSDQRVGL